MNNRIDELYEKHGLNFLRMRKMTDFSGINAALAEADEQDHPEILIYLYEAALRSSNKAMIEHVEQCGFWEKTSADQIARLAFDASKFASRMEPFDESSFKASRYAMLWQPMDRGRVEDFIAISIIALNEHDDIKQRLNSFSNQLQHFRFIGQVAGMPAEDIMNLVLEALTTTCIPENSDLIKPVVSEINKVFPTEIPDFNLLCNFSENSYINKIQGYAKSYEHFVVSLADKRLGSIESRMIYDNLDKFPDETILGLSNLKVEEILNGRNTLLLNSLLHGSWLDNIQDSKRLADAMALIENIVAAPRFKFLTANIDSLSTFVGHMASILTSEVMKKHATHVYAPSGKYSEDTNAAELAFKHFSKLTDDQRQIVHSICKDFSPVRRMVKAYDMLAQDADNHYNLKPEASMEDKIKAISCLIIHEKAIEKPSRKDAAKLPSPVTDAFRRLTGTQGNPIFQLGGLCNILVHGMSDDEKLAIAPKNKPYIKSLLLNELIGKEHIAKLGAKDKRELLTSDFGI